MTISVVLATYNGEKTLKRQFDSLKAQTMQPDEVLICDDHSSDHTVEYTSQYIRDNDLSNWKLSVNEQNQGWKKNFIEGVKKATGDIIFLCDQDDIWYPEKIKEMIEPMNNNPEILLLACDYHVIYEEGAIKAKVYQKTRSEREEMVSRYQFKTRFFMNPNPGCTYAMRKSFVQEVIDRWFDPAPHDEFFWLMATLQNGAYFRNQVLMDFVRGAGNASDIKYKDIQMQKENLNYIRNMLDRMENYAISNQLVPEEYLEKIRKAKTWCKKRMSLMDTRNPLRWLTLMPWWGYYNSIQNCLSDLYLVLFGSFKRQS